MSVDKSIFRCDRKQIEHRNRSCDNLRLQTLEGFTQQINTALHEYAYGGTKNVTMDDYVNPTNDFNRTALR